MFAHSAFAVTPLAADGVKALVAAPAKGERVIALWSLDCAYCEENLTALAKLQREHRDIDLVIVATDSIEQHEAIDARLKQAGLADVPSRAYADATPDRLNYLIDPAWGGETPRTLVIRADGTRQGYSGALDAKRLAKIAL
ncbi:redoxin domain-containing protein [Luteibacter rhizovicinus]|uniref:redoxin domain-containing protein n=1 Tax=Luteibacter rhizovicinus TaxID=242606 RepID=UPI001FB21D1C|nr:redoxin domain-containing protein [Luteibacter rhizovicinus]